jgi:hypothetical protein
MVKDNDDGTESEETFRRIKRHIVLVPHSFFAEFNSKKQQNSQQYIPDYN